MKTVRACHRCPLARSFSRGHGLQQAVILAFGALLAVPASSQFVPGSGGSIPVIAPLQGIPNQIGGLNAFKNDRRNNYFAGGTHAELDLTFPPPSVHGASGYRLQRSVSGVSGWEDHPWGVGFLETSSSSQDNFSFTPDGVFHYRLLVQGGPRSGEVSNVVFAAPSMVDTRFSGWGLDESMWITGIMAPLVGRGLQANFSVAKLEDESPVTGCLTYQWYRVNPLSSEMTLIPGATGLTYTTTNADVGGYDLLCRATGDGVNAGGFVQISSSWGVVIPNNSFASNVTMTGFRLNLHKSVPSLSPTDLLISYWNGTETVNLPVTSVTALEGNASFDLAVTVPEDATELNLRNESDVWVIGQEMSFMPGMPPHFMQALRIVVRTPFEVWAASNPGIPADRRGALDRNGPCDLQNLAAYAMGLDPMSASSADLPRVTALDSLTGRLHFVYRRAKYLSDATLQPQVSGDLSSWENATVVSETIIQDGGDWERVDAVISFAPGPCVFLNLAAEQSNR